MAKLRKSDILKIIEWRDIGLTNEEIGKKLGVHSQSVCYWIKRLRQAGYDVPTPNKGGSNINL